VVPTFSSIVLTWIFSDCHDSHDFFPFSHPGNP
jgi:hypothetical protein